MNNEYKSKLESCERISSKDNPKIKRLAKLMKSSKARKEEGSYIIEGAKPVAEALRARRAVEVYFSERAYSESAENLLDTGDSSESSLNDHIDYLSRLKLYVISDNLYEKVSDTVTPQGVLAVVKIHITEDEDINSEYSDIYSKNNSKIIFLDEVRDPGNIGTIVRTAEGAGFDGVVLSRGCADVYQPKVVRSTMGSLLRVPVINCDRQTEDELREFKNKGFTIYASDLSGAVDYTQAGYEGRVLVIIGNEANGISDAAKELADERISIPMGGEVESLNAAVSAALVMYEVRRHRGEADK